MYDLPLNVAQQQPTAGPQAGASPGQKISQTTPGDQMADRCIAEQPEAILFGLIGRRREATEGLTIVQLPRQRDRLNQVPAGLERAGHRQIHGDHAFGRNRCIRD